MKVAGSHIFEASPQAVWDALQDPEMLAATMPGCDKLERVGEDEYDGVLNIKVGPVQGRFQGKIKLEDVSPPDGYTMLVDGSGAPGFVKAKATIRIAADGDRTRLDYDGDARVGGRIASVGQRLLDSSAKAIIKQSLEGLNENLKARAGATTQGTTTESGTGPPPAKVETPSQTDFAARVAKEVAKDLVPRPVLIAILAALALLIAYLILR